MLVPDLTASSDMTGTLPQRTGTEISLLARLICFLLERYLTRSIQASKKWCLVLPVESSEVLPLFFNFATRRPESHCKFVVTPRVACAALYLNHPLVWKRKILVSFSLSFSLKWWKMWSLSSKIEILENAMKNEDVCQNVIVSTNRAGYFRI